MDQAGLKPAEIDQIARDFLEPEPQRRSFTAVIEKNSTFTSPFETEPYETIGVEKLKDTGYGGLLNVRHTVRGYEEAGASAHLVGLLRAAVGATDGVDIAWREG